MGKSLACYQDGQFYLVDEEELKLLELKVQNVLAEKMKSDLGIPENLTDPKTFMEYIVGYAK